MSIVDRFRGRPARKHEPENRDDGRLRLLFVDDEPLLLLALRRTLRGQRNAWRMEFAGGGAEALETLSQERFDVVVSDMRMPGIDGAELLRQVREKYPDMIRLVLSGFSEQEMTVKLVNTAHQYLSKPCDPQELVRTVDRAVALRGTLHSPELRALIARLHTLPSPPDIYHQVCRQMADPHCRIEQIAETIQGDPAMTAKVLQLVNSSFFGFARNITDVTHAVSLLGLNLCSALILSIHIFEQLRNRPAGLGDLSQHSYRTAALAKRYMATTTQDPAQLSAAFTAGMLHDLGKLVIGHELPDTFARLVDEARDSGRAFEDIERERLGATHADVGAYLLGLWNLPDAVVESVAFHHRPADCIYPGMSPLTAVHLANVFDRRNQPGGLPGALPEIDHDYLETLGLGDELNRFAEIADEVERGEAASTDPPAEAA